MDTDRAVIQIERCAWRLVQPEVGKKEIEKKQMEEDNIIN